MLATLLSLLENMGSASLTGPSSSSAIYSSSVKCVPSYVAPDLASGIRRHIAQSFRQRKGAFPCQYLIEWATYSLPPGKKKWASRGVFSLDILP